MAETKSNLISADPTLKRNYHLMYDYLIYLLDSGLNYLKREYLTRYKKEDIIKYNLISNFFDFVLRENIRNKIKAEVRAVLGAALYINENFDGNDVPTEELDNIIEKRYPQYEKNDMTLLHTSETHPGHQELKIISKLTFRVIVIQSARVMSCRNEDVKQYEDLIRNTFPTIEEARKSINAILGMADQMLDCFETHIDMINIPIYKPTFTLRDFEYVRKLYEFTLTVLDDLLKRNYNMEDSVEIE